VKWNGHLIKKDFVFPSSRYFFSLLIKKNKIPRFLRQYDLFQHFCCCSYLKIIFTTRLWDHVYIAGLSEMQPILQCLEYFETLNLALSIWSVSMVEIEKWLDMQYIFSVKYRCRICQGFTSTVFHNWKGNIYSLCLFLVLQFSLSRTVWGIYLMQYLLGAWNVNTVILCSVMSCKANWEIKFLQK